MVLPNFKENLEKYAKLLVANGINVQPGHTLALSIDVEQRGLEWAKKVFPNATSDEEAVDLLWDQIFKTCRVYEADPVKAWEEHAAILKSKADMLNKEQFSALHYTAPGTDLTLGLP
ncbi:aminopeptidase, partial [Streptococcus pneumoniae]|uniref:aminopeptidase n=1 Tax=Streptococcus pneumoniae TaxID=1313 RepID=UPI000AF4D79B